MTSQTPPNAPAAMNAAILFAWIGGIVFALGLLFLVVYAFEQGWVSKPLQVLLGIFFGMGLSFAGVRLHKKAALQGTLLAGAGLAVMYFTLFAGYAADTYRQAIGLSFTVTFLLLLMVVAGGIYLSVRLKSASLLAETMLLAHLALFISHDLLSGAGWLIAAYILALTAGFAVFVGANAWRSAAYAGGAISFFTLLVLSFIVEAIPMMALLVGLFGVYTWLSIYRDNQFAQALVMAGTLVIGLILSSKLSFDADWFVLALALMSLALGFLVSTQGKKSWYAVIATALLALWIPLALDRAYITPALAILAGVAGWVGVRYTSLRILETANSILLFAFFKLLVIDTWFLDGSSRTYACLFVFAVSAILGVVYSRAQRKEYVVAATTALLAAIVWGLLEFPSLYKTAFIVLLGAGLWKLSYTWDKPLLRHVSWIGISIAFLKVLAYDSFLPSLERIVSFLVFSVVLYTLRFVDARTSRIEKHVLYILATISLALFVLAEFEGLLLTIMLGVIGTVSYGIGVSKGFAEGRNAGFVFITLALLKLFLVDTLTLSPGLRIVAYITLGALIFGTSLLYAKKSK